ncbi:hypothetical protein LPJ61_002407 [Coemansia biformis]|uniref:Uncharacterized protein n=1 Tax=Coemansia biformis TaxID=1286918 RepID=A0A9W7Y8E7_9FUNG|nr:hypothetical protein LPJ61_002407 [Coemansia biformis]
MPIAVLARQQMAPRRVAPTRRTLATGLVFVRRLPGWAGPATLERAAAAHGHVYGAWATPPWAGQGPSPGAHTEGGGPAARMAAVRIATEKVPRDLAAIAQLPDPAGDEIRRCEDALLLVVRTLGQQGIRAMPVSKNPDLFQVAARRALGLGPATRRFDLRTTSTPRYTRGLVDGYRRGFAEARRQQDVAGLLQQCEESDDELYFMSECFEHLQ